jgi:hypothetical protein
VNILSPNQQVNVAGALTEGYSIRSVERLTHIHRDTIMRLAARVGLGAGKRDFENTALFANDLRERVINPPEISSDGWPSYGPAIRDAFGSHCARGVIQKIYAAEPVKDAARRYSPGYVVAVERRNVIGLPANISTQLRCALQSMGWVLWPKNGG